MSIFDRLVARYFLRVQVETYPDDSGYPMERKFHLKRKITDGYYTNNWGQPGNQLQDVHGDTAPEHINQLARSLLEICGVEKIWVTGTRVTLSIGRQSNWSTIEPDVFRALSRHFGTSRVWVTKRIEEHYDGTRCKHGTPGKILAIS